MLQLLLNSVVTASSVMRNGNRSDKKEFFTVKRYLTFDADLCLAISSLQAFQWKTKGEHF